MSDEIEPYKKELCKMIFIYNTLLKGWSVKMLEKNKFQFTNKNEEIRREYFGDNFIRDFIKNNLNETEKYCVKQK